MNASSAPELSANHDIAQYIEQVGRNARDAALTLARATTAQKNAALAAVAEAIVAQADALADANTRDCAAASAAGLDSAMLDRLTLTPARVEAMATGLREIAELPDPIGELNDLRYRPSGIQVGRMRVPLGVVGIIYESRPNVTADAAALCVKSSNAAILRGGSEALHSNQAIARCIREGLTQAGLPEHSIQVIDTTDRAAVGALLSSPQWVDVIVPRGGKGLIERVSADAKMPVIKHLDGVCHVFLDASAERGKGHAIALNAKIQRLGTCNTMETLLAMPAAAERIFPDLLAEYRSAGIELRGCERTQSFNADVLPASEADWFEEYLGPVLAIRIVDSLDEAMAHIRDYGSAHTDCIVTEDFSRARRFIREVDSSSVMVNASTRFADGFEYGLGAEIGISTDKFHARGPVGLEGLTSQKWVVLGDGQIRE